MGTLSDVARYLVDTAVTLYLIVVVVRGLLQISKADFYNPISQFIVKATNPPLALLRKVIPGGRQLDPATFVLALLVQFAGLCAVILLSGYMLPNLLTVLAWSALALVGLIVNVYFVALLVMIVVSWVAPGTRNPAIILLYQITEPVMAPFRSLLPAMGGMDFSPILLFVLINVIQIVLRNMAVSIGLPAGLVVGI